MTKYNILILGNGGRESALLWKLLHNTTHISELHLIPYHVVVPPRSSEISVINNDDVSFDYTHIQSVVEYCLKNKIHLVIPGSEQFLALGIQDSLKKVGILCFGPSKAAAQIETSKEFSKEFMAKYNIPTARFKTFKNQKEAIEYAKLQHFPIVIKASGLAYGKGVVIAKTLEEAIEAIHMLMEEKRFGIAGDTIIIEEHLSGEEVSFLCFTDGYAILPLPVAQDYKRIDDQDMGPNTGGMGAVAPVPWISLEIMDKIIQMVIQPTLFGLRKEGFPFCGVLYAGLMIDRTYNRIHVLEFNARFGDPEAQAILPLLHPETDLLEVILACIEGRLDTIDLKFYHESSAVVVLVSQGYPNTHGNSSHLYYDADQTILEGLNVFFSGIQKDSHGSLMTSSGRVASVQCCRSNLVEALKSIYNAIHLRRCIYFERMHYRTDIGNRSLNQVKRTFYVDAGVNIDTGNEFVRKIKPLVKVTSRKGADGEIGGFGGMFDLSKILNDQIKHPVLVSSTDGVGTKLLIAQKMEKYDTIGIDLVAMNVNDVLTQGAEPLYFMDYYATSSLELDVSLEIIKGICEGCLESGCALIGGETAEMPNLYRRKDFDFAGFAVGIVDHSCLLPNFQAMKSGDVVFGLSSNGFHSNGYSLVRYILNSKWISLHDSIPAVSNIDNNVSSTIGDLLLEPTIIYVPFILPILRKYPGMIKGMAHITGGGFIENIPRILPNHLQAALDAHQWEIPWIMKHFKTLIHLSNDEFVRTWNCGIGIVIIIDALSVPVLENALAEEMTNIVADSRLSKFRRHHGRSIKMYSIGHLKEKTTSSDPSVVIHNM